MLNDEWTSGLLTGYVVGVLVGWLLFGGNAHALEQDKVQHVAVSSAIAATATMLLEDKTENPVLYGASTALAVGIAKEVYDAAHPKSHTASGADLAADLAGAVAGAWFGHGIYLQVNPRAVSLGISRAFRRHHEQPSQFESRGIASAFGLQLAYCAGVCPRY